MSNIPSLDVVARIYEGRKAVGFKLVDIETGQEYMQPDANVKGLIEAGAVDGLLIVGGKITSGEILLSELPKQDKRGNDIQKKQYVSTGNSKRNKLTITERHEKIVNAFADDGSIEYELHTCMNMIKLYKSDDLSVKLSNQTELIHSLKVALEDERNGLYYVFSVFVEDATNDENEIWKAHVEMVELAKVSKNTKLSSINKPTFDGKELNSQGFYINEEGKRVFVDTRSLVAEDRFLTSKEILELRLDRGKVTVLNEFVMGEVIPGDSHVANYRLNCINKLVQYMYMFKGLVENINKKVQAM